MCSPWCSPRLTDIYTQAAEPVSGAHPLAFGVVHRQCRRAGRTRPASFRLEVMFSIGSDDGVGDLPAHQALPSRMAVRGASHVHQCGGDHQTPATKTVHLVSLEKPTTVAGPHHDPRYSATERCWRQSGGDWGIFRAGRGSEARRDGTVSEAYTSCRIIPWPREPVCNYYSAWDGGRAPDTVSSPPPRRTIPSSCADAAIRVDSTAFI